MLLYNPDNGAEISDIVFSGTHYFISRDNQQFKPGEIVKIDSNEAAEFIKKTYEFVREVSLIEAKAIQQKKKDAVYKCEKEGCDYATDDEKKFKGHNLFHAKEDKIDKELGIRVATGRNREGIAVRTAQDDIDNQATADGLIGEGLVKENI